jgi:hypothetical protein
LAHSWGDALEALLCVATTPALRRTGAGSAPAVWNLLDNARLNFERSALQRVGDEREEAPGATQQARDDVELVASSSPAGRAEPDLDVWERFHALAAQRVGTLGPRGVPEDEL